MKNGDKVAYEDFSCLLVKRVGDLVLIDTGANSRIKCHVSDLGPLDGIAQKHINLTTRWWRWSGIEKRVGEFFKEILTSPIPPTRQLLLRANIDKGISSQYILDILNRYGVYGCAGVINIHYEWNFRRPTYSDQEALEIIHAEQTRESDYLCDIGARGRSQHYAMRKNIKVSHFIGEVVDLRLYRNRELEVAI